MFAGPEPEPWGAQVQAVANQTSSFPLPDEPGFDDLLGQLAQCSQQWREDRRQLEINIREMDLLRKMNREQTVKIQSMQIAMKNLQGVVQTFGTQEQANKTNGNASAMSPAAVNGMEAYYSGEFRKAQATINDLKNVIKQYEAAARDSNGLRERNQTLEAQLAEKTAEAVSAHETLATLTGASKPKKPKPYSSQNRSANQTPAQPYNKSLNNPTWRAKPSRSKNTRQNTNSTDTPRLPLHRPDITSGLYSGSNATITFSPNVNINAAIESARQTIENTNDFLRNGQVMYSSPYSLAQAGTLQPGQYASTAPVMGSDASGLGRWNAGIECGEWIWAEVVSRREGKGLHCIVCRYCIVCRDCILCRDCIVCRCIPLIPFLISAIPYSETDSQPLDII